VAAATTAEITKAKNNRGWNLMEAPLLTTTAQFLTMLLYCEQGSREDQKFSMLNRAAVSIP